MICGESLHILRPIIQMRRATSGKADRCSLSAPTFDKETEFPTPKKKLCGCVLPPKEVNTHPALRAPLRGGDCHAPGADVVLIVGPSYSSMGPSGVQVRKSHGFPDLGETASETD